MKIVFLDRSTLGFDIDLSCFNALGGEVTVYDTTKPHQTLSRLKGADVVITNKVVIDRSIMEQTQLKLICVAATGMNNIDVEYAKSQQICVKNVKGYSTSSVVQLTLSMVLHFIQDIGYFNEYTKKGNWITSDIFTHLDQPFHELEGKKWGVIGLGQIGTKVATVAQVLGCDVSYYSTSGLNNDAPFSQVDLSTLLSQSDIISIHAPLNDSTYSLIAKDQLQLLKEGAVLLNLGRGGIVHEEDLAYMLDQKLFYCGLDVLEQEPMVSSSPLQSIKNKDQLLITPHIGWASVQARERLVQAIYHNIQEFYQH